MNTEFYCNDIVKLNLDAIRKNISLGRHKRYQRKYEEIVNTFVNGNQILRVSYSTIDPFGINQYVTSYDRETLFYGDELIIMDRANNLSQD